MSPSVAMCAVVVMVTGMFSFPLIFVHTQKYKQKLLTLDVHIVYGGSDVYNI